MDDNYFKVPEEFSDAPLEEQLSFMAGASRLMAVLTHHIAGLQKKGILTGAANEAVRAEFEKVYLQLVAEARRIGGITEEQEEELTDI